VFVQVEQVFIAGGDEIGLSGECAVSVRPSPMDLRLPLGKAMSRWGTYYGGCVHFNSIVDT
jgi:hypothetical protein